MTFNKTLLAGISALAIGYGAALAAAAAQDSAPAAPEAQPPAAQQPAPAPAPTPATPEAQAPAASPQLDDEKLKSFAVAFLDVTKVTQQYQPQIAAAGNEEEQQRLQQEAGEKMVEVVDNAQGINVDEYNMIIQAAQTDPELAQRINGHITEVAGAAGGGQQPAPEQPAAQE